MTKPIVLLDCDGVLADFITPSLHVIERLTGVLHEHDDVDVWDFDKTFISPEQVHSSMSSDRAIEGLRKEYWARVTAPGFCASLRPYEGAQRAVERLHAIADVYIVTSPMLAPAWAHERQQWLREHFGIDHKHIVSTPAKRLVFGHVFVDDKPEHVEAWQRDWQGYAGLCWARAYNETWAEDFGAYRTSDWSFVERKVREAVAR